MSTTLQALARTPAVLLTSADENLLKKVGDDFSAELDRLKRAYSVRDRNVSLPTSKSPSQILFGEDYDEVNRTLVGVLTLSWIYTGQYEILVGSQPEATRLTTKSFAWLVEFFQNVLAENQDTCYTLLTSMVVNDLGKDPQLAKDYQETIASRGSHDNQDISSLNHDMILFKAVEVDLVPSLDRLPPDDRSDLLRGMRLGAVLNLGQLAQAETVPACLAPLEGEMRGHHRALRLRFAEQLLDVAGAAGHVDWTCAKMLNEPTFASYRSAYEACVSVVEGRSTPRAAYDLVLVQHAEMLAAKGFCRPLDVVRQPADRALARLVCMGRVANSEKARLYETAWDELDPTCRASLVRALNVDGSAAEPAVQPTYAPALLAQVTDVEERLRGRALQSAWRYLARVMSKPVKPDGHVTVFERSVLSVLKETVQSDEFRSNPDILDVVPIPPAVPVATVEDAK